MQVAILCGGRGTRIRGTVADAPKPMVPIGSYPILWHIMKTYAHYGHQDFLLCLGYRSQDIKQFFLNYQDNTSDFTVRFGEGGHSVDHHNPPAESGWSVTCAETGLDAMTGARVKRIEKYLDGDTFMLTYGDGVGTIDIDKLVSFHKAHGKIATLTAVMPPGRFGDLELDGDQITSFQEKPQVSGAVINGGYFVLDRRVFEYLDDREDLIFEREPLQRLAADGELMAYRHDGFWLPMDTYREFQVLDKLWRSGEAPWKVWN